ncbi:TetR/AcrR family transcriptional regulator [Calditerrivibrio nitroreducens]|uniref:Regulatory protein TetR n=1 Tax=Calditerrivibrio nitroreducens (strain DSM 19672 / NBRC 101217 / Yu37-1) TaxID=768670 RepID=E4TH04_CALNY|nr:TetR/AcrR family transcriptional regulator [Calditerrivibrio nitroreducens]ADR19802.1 regulatory protein TetR [Calditerrivibrio nitroreducens DSM 19672]
MAKNLYPDKKKLLMEAAVDVFSEKGFWQTKISDIVKKADLAQGTFYNYFKNKEAIFKEILLRLHQEFVDEIEEMFEHNTDNICDKFVSKMIDSFICKKKIIKIFLYEVLSLGDEFIELYYYFKDKSEFFCRKALSIDFPNMEESSRMKKAFILSAFLRSFLELHILKENKTYTETKSLIEPYIKEILG